MIYLGTSGFSYEDWVGPFYPSGLPKREWLTYYAREFSACEINSTYYAIPRLEAVDSMAGRTGENFQFVIKANRQMTHEISGDTDVCDAFRQVLQPMIARGKLGCVLAQFPYSFRCNDRNRQHIESLRQRLDDLPVVVEFRNAGWLREEVFGWMRHHRLGFCCVDEPRLPNLLPPLAEATSDIAYVRFHGRNGEKWWQHEHAYERYDYSYPAAELEEWVPKIKGLERATEKAFVFANNHWRGQAVDTIRQLRMMLD